MADRIEKRIMEAGYQLPEPVKHGEFIAAVVPFGEKLLYVSGIGSDKYGCGRVPGTVSKKDAIKAAEDCALRAISTLKEYVGDLDRIKKFVKILAFVSSDTGFTEQHLVANGASETIIKIFGKEIGHSARSAVGVAELPLDCPVEVEMIVELK